jgi:NAD(P)-dependent dehydrogenase (short-subunit alcohol dehydrogenase family)
MNTETSKAGQRFAGKVVIVTGAGAGIGRATALAFAAEGGTLLAADVDADSAEATAGEIREAGGKASACRADVSVFEDCARMVAKAVDRFGALHVAFNNAGITGPFGRAVHEMPLESWNRVLGVNLSGVFHCMKAEVPAMLASGGGAIINTSSVAGLVGGASLAAYAASKHGVLGLTKAASVDLIRLGIRVNAICPGATQTNMLAATIALPEVRAQMEAAHPIGRVADPVEVARAVLFLASDESSFIVGHALSVDGGVVAV